MRLVLTFVLLAGLGILVQTVSFPRNMSKYLKPGLKLTMYVVVRDVLKSKQRSVFVSLARYASAIAAVFIFPSVMTPGYAQEQKGFCVEITMDLEDLRLSYMKDLQARLDLGMTAAGVSHFGLNIKGDKIEMVLMSVDDNSQAQKALAALNVAMPNDKGAEFVVETEGDGRIFIRPNTAMLDEIKQSARNALQSKTRLIAGLKTDGKPIVTPTSEKAFLVFAPGLQSMDEYLRPFQFAPSVDLSFRLWPQPKEGAPAPAFNRRTMQPVRRGLETRRLVMITRERFADGRDIVSAKPAKRDGVDGLSIQFSARSAAMLAEITRENSGDIIAILLSNIIMAEYKITDEVKSGAFFVPVSGSDADRKNLAEKIQSAGRQPLHKTVESDRCTAG